MQPFALEAEAFALGAPRKWGKKKEIQKMSYLIVMWNSFWQEIFRA